LSTPFFRFFANPVYASAAQKKPTFVAAKTPLPPLFLLMPHCQPACDFGLFFAFGDLASIGFLQSALRLIAPRSKARGIALRKSRVPPESGTAAHGAASYFTARAT